MVSFLRLLIFSKEKSHSYILTFGLSKEGFHQLRKFLNSAQCAEGELFHLVLGLDQLPRDSALDMSPDLLVGVQMRRVRRQVEQLETALLRLDEHLDRLGLVDRVTIDDQKDGRMGSDVRGTRRTLRH